MKGCEAVFRSGLVAKGGPAVLVDRNDTERDIFPDNPPVVRSTTSAPYNRGLTTASRLNSLTTVRGLVSLCDV